MPAVMQLQPHGRERLQQYIDAVCGRMQDAESPGHHIVVQSKSITIQASAHHRASPEILQAIHDAVGDTNPRISNRRDKLVVGAYTRGETTIYVSEFPLHSSIVD